MASASESSGSTVKLEEAAHFGRLAADWWNPRGSSAMLHRLNPVRLGYIRDQVNRYWGADERERRPLVGKSAADVGCGAGLLAEPLARLGARVTGVDPAAENIAEAQLHAAGQGLDIDYRVGSVEALSGPYELITCLEVIEHVSQPAAFVSGLAGALAQDGLLIMSTPNRTATSRLALIVVGEGTGQIPRDTHDWDQFLSPDELRSLLERAGLEVIDTTGLTFSVSRGFRLSRDLSLNYLVTARRAG
jgi:2-polyprenyl-6-hydroxyphenyl methylase/3-demethylubiquinone-9 3-methyltransferase